MPEQTNDLYEIRLRQTFLGQNVVNMFYYMDVDTGDPITIDNVSSKFKSDVYDTIVTAQNVDALGVDIRTRKVGGINENILPLVGEDGIRVGQAINSFAAWGFTFLRSNTDVRNGSKRITGITEGDVQGNSPSGLIETILDDLAAVFAINLLLASGAILTPVIYRRESFLDGTWIGTLVSDVVFSALTSQVSRKARAG